MVCRKNCSLGTQSSRSEDRAHRLRAGFPINVVAAEGCIGARALHRCPTNSWASMDLEGIYGDASPGRGAVLDRSAGMTTGVPQTTADLRHRPSREESGQKLPVP